MIVSEDFRERLYDSAIDIRQDLASAADLIEGMIKCTYRLAYDTTPVFLTFSFEIIEGMYVTRADWIAGPVSGWFFMVKLDSGWKIVESEEVERVAKVHEISEKIADGRIKPEIIEI